MCLRAPKEARRSEASQKREEIMKIKAGNKGKSKATMTPRAAEESSVAKAEGAGQPGARRMAANRKDKHSNISKEQLDYSMLDREIIHPATDLDELAMRLDCPVETLQNRRREILQRVPVTGREKYRYIDPLIIKPGANITEIAKRVGFNRGTLGRRRRKLLGMGVKRRHVAGEPSQPVIAGMVVELRSCNQKWDYTNVDPLLFREGWSTKRIAKHVGIPHGTIISRKKRLDHEIILSGADLHGLAKHLGCSVELLQHRRGAVLSRVSVRRQENSKRIEPRAIGPGADEVGNVKRTKSRMITLGKKRSRSCNQKWDYTNVDPLLFREGWSTKRIANHVGIPHGTIISRKRLIANSMSSAPDPAMDANGNIDYSKIDPLLFAEGWSASMLSRRFGVPEYAIFTRRKKMREPSREPMKAETFMDAIKRIDYTKIDPLLFEEGWSIDKLVRYFNVSRGTITRRRKLVRAHKDQEATVEMALGSGDVRPLPTNKGSRETEESIESIVTEFMRWWKRRKKK